MIKIALLGSTGSIGVQTLEVAARHKERFEIVSLAAGKNVRTFFNQLEKFAPAVGTLSAAPETEKEKIFSENYSKFKKLADSMTLREFSTSNLYTLRSCIEDPYGEDLETYRACASEIKLCVDGLVEELENLHK